MATKQDIRNEGFRRGQAVASWVDMPEIGTRIDRSIDHVGLGERVTAENQYEYWELCCYEAENNDRQFSPFEQTAHTLNEMVKPYDVWEVFEAGTSAGIQAYGRKHHKAELANASEEE